MSREYPRTMRYAQDEDSMYLPSAAANTPRIDQAVSDVVRLTTGCLGHGGRGV
jgi:hypothetical protein